MGIWNDCPFAFRLCDALSYLVAGRSLPALNEYAGVNRIFQDTEHGVGRPYRLLSLLLLYKNGFDAGKYVSFEEQINNYKTYYYEALRQSSAEWETNENSYFPFIENFLSTLYMCYKELDKRFAVVHGKKITKKARIEATVLNSLTPLSKAEICKILPDVSPTTVEAVLGVMVKTGSIKRIGAGRMTKYIKA